ncbi:MAG TPA: hypothetical protein DCM87_14945 [Planctomycetes bacterium]|nr:hypothetical protein [Planctomycetota bacterium]
MDDRRILDCYPLPLARAYRRYLNATETRESHDAAYYLYEAYLKYVASIAVAGYLATEARDHRTNAILKGLARPSLGEWARFLRECVRFLRDAQPPDPVIAAMHDLLETKEARWTEVLALYNGLREFLGGKPSERERVSLALLLEEIVAYRNRVIGHGAPRGRDHYERFAQLMGTAYPVLLAHSPFLTARRLAVFDALEIEARSEVRCTIFEYMGTQPIRRAAPLVIPYGNAVPNKHLLYLLDDHDRFVTLHPLLVAHREDVYLLNDVDGVPEYISYATGECYRPEDLPDAQGVLLGRVLGYRVDAQRLTGIAGDIAPPPAPSDAPVARRLGDFRIVKEIGHGGMGAVFEAVQESLGRRVALKVLPGSFALDRTRIERFRREARATARIHHPNIVPVYEVGEADGTHYYAMEYIAGATLDTLLARARDDAARTKHRKGSSTSDPAFIAHVVAEIAALAEGLQQAHVLGLVHRDVKPSNILADAAGRYVLIDFGLVHEADAAAITQSGEMLGTVHYMSPEQVSRRPVDARTDVYSLGVTLYEIVAGRPPFQAAAEHEIQHAILFKEPVPPRALNPRVHRDLETIVLHAMEKDPDRRYQSALAMAQDLRKFLRYEPILARPRSALTRLSRRIWKHRGKAAAAALAAIVLATTALLVRERNLRNLADYESSVARATTRLHVRTTVTRPRGERMQLPFQFFTGLTDVQAVVKSCGAEPVAAAARELAAAAALDSSRPDAHYHHARALLLLDLDDEARAVIDRALRRQPDFVPARVLRAAIRESRRDREGATEDLTEAAASAEDSWRRAWLSAHLAMRAEDWAGAVEACNALIGSIEKEGEPYVGADLEARMGRGVALLEQGEYVNARDDFAAVRSQHHALEPVLLGGKARYLLGEREAAEREFRDALQGGAFPADEVALGVAATYLDLMEYERALAWVNRLSVEYIREEIKITIHMNLGDIGKALAAARKAVGLTAGHPNATVRARMHQALAQVLCDGVKHYREALEAIRTAAALDPADSFSLVLWAEILCRIGEYGNAVEKARDAIAREERKGGALGLWYTMLGDALRGDGKLDEALAEYKRALEFSPNNPSVLYNWGITHLRLGNLPATLAAFDAAIARAPEWSWALRGKAYALLEHGRPQEAMTSFNAMLEKYPREFRNYAVAAWALARQGRLDEARDMLRRGEEEGPPRRTDNYREIGPFILDGGYAWIGGDAGGAIEAFRTAIADPDAEPQQLSFLWEHLGRIQESLGDLDAACAAYANAVVLAPGERESDERGAYECWCALLRREEKPANLGTEIDRVLRKLEAAAGGEQSLPAAAMQALALCRLHHPARRNIAGAIDCAQRLAGRDGNRNERRDRLAFLAGVHAEARDWAAAARTLEDAASSGAADPSAAIALDTCRRRALPRVASFAACDALLAARGEETLVAARGPWQFFRATTEPPQEWTALAFDASAWDVGPGPFACGFEYPARGTSLEGMPGAYTALYARHVFRVDDPRAFVRCLLVVRADDGFIAYLNGNEVGRARAGPPGIAVPSKGSAVSAGNAGAPICLAIDAGALRPGDNCLAIQGLNDANRQTSFFLHAELTAALAADAAARRDVVDRVSRAAADETARTMAQYLTARALQLDGVYDEAAKRFADLCASSLSSPEPRLRHAECLHAAGATKEAAAVLRAALPEFPAARELWDFWWKLAVCELRHSAEDLPALLPSDVKGYGGELRWAAERCGRKEPIRIDCGARADTTAGDIEWAADRFFQGGAPYEWEQWYFETYVAGGLGEPIYRSERSFGVHDDARYSVPLPRGTYVVALYLAEIRCKERGARQFDVLLEGRKVLDRYAPVLQGGNGERCEFTGIEVEDGFLDIVLGRACGDPQIAAIHIEPAP